jgi:hypothetical protein
VAATEEHAHLATAVDETTADVALALFAHLEMSMDPMRGAGHVVYTNEQKGLDERRGVH